VSDIRFAELVHAAEIGKPQAKEKLFVSLYDALRQMARRELRRGFGASLTPTALLHETYLNISQRESVAFTNRGQFMSYAARAMRGLIVGYLRNRHAQKRGGEIRFTSLPIELPPSQEGLDAQSMRIEELNDALQLLEKIDVQLAECVDLKFFCGFSFAEIAELRDVSERTVQRDWNKARILLRRFIANQQPAFRAIS
jgi:RNA polymerase sigma factor (TIGR02999 family)